MNGKQKRDIKRTRPDIEQVTAVESRTTAPAGVVEPLQLEGSRNDSCCEGLFHLRMA